VEAGSAGGGGGSGTRGSSSEGSADKAAAMKVEAVEAAAEKAIARKGAAVEVAARAQGSTGKMVLQLSCCLLASLFPVWYWLHVLGLRWLVFT